jgi:hypothetical protein
MSQYSVHPSLTFTATSCSTITSSESGRASGRLCQPFGRVSLRGLNPWYPLSPIVGGLIWCVATWKATGIVLLYCAVSERIASHDVRGPSQYLFDVVVAVHLGLSWLARTRPRIQRDSHDPYYKTGVVGSVCGDTRVRGPGICRGCGVGPHQLARTRPRLDTQGPTSPCD